MGLILGVQIYIIIGMVIALASTMVVMKGLTDSKETELVKVIVRSGNVKLFAKLVAVTTLVWPMALGIAIAKNKK